MTVAHRYVAMLRAVNVSGRNSVSMDELRALFRSLGAEDVKSYLQSGNVVFTSEAHPNELIEALDRALRDELGVPSRVLLRTGEQLSKILDGNPFLKRGVEPHHLHVTFLSQTPDNTKAALLAGETFGGDEFDLHKLEIYVHCPHGYGRTKLNNAFFEKRFAIAATTRNWRTVSALTALAAS